MKDVLSPLSGEGLIAIGALAVAGWRPLRSWSIFLAIPGAVLVGVWSPHRESFVPVLVAIAVWRGSISTAQLDDDFHRDGTVPVLYLLSAAGAYACLPDTEQIIPLAVTAFVVALIAVALPGLLFGGPIAMAAVGVYGWVAATGGLAVHPRRLVHWARLVSSCSPEVCVRVESSSNDSSL